MALRCATLFSIAASVVASVDVDLGTAPAADVVKDLGVSGTSRNLRAAVSESTTVQEKAGETTEQEVDEELASVLRVAVTTSSGQPGMEAASSETQEVPLIAAGVTASSAGRCSADDQQAMAKLGGGNGGGSFPKKVSDCGHSAYSWFSFHKSDMQRCVQGLGLSSRCASCFADAGQWAIGNCKAACFFGSWCSNSCLSCIRRHTSENQACVGADIAIPEASTC